MNNSYSDLAAMLGAVMQPNVVNSFINLLESFDAYEDKRDRKHSDEKLVLNAYRLYQSGSINRDQLLQIVELLTLPANQQSVQSNQSLNKIRLMLED